ncbi:MAG: rhomboid family intramembrane serine protease [Acidimicrobiales bacterium]
MTDSDGRAPLVARVLSTTFGLLIALVAVAWLVEIVDSTLLDDRLQQNGIHPRELGGLPGIIWTPWLHAGFGHLASNTVPFVALGWLVALRGLRYWALVTIAAVVIGGGLTWLFAGGSNHIGASGVVFSYFGALLGGAIYDRRPALLAPALVALLMYSGMIAGLVPQRDISWEGHLFGLLAGFLVARQLADPPPDSTDEDEDIPYPWEAGEPWLDTDPEP